MDLVTLALAKKYTQQSLDGAGALKGAPCQISNITDNGTNLTVTFSWEDKNGTTYTNNATLPKGIAYTAGSNITISADNKISATVDQAVIEQVVNDALDNILVTDDDIKDLFK